MWDFKKYKNNIAIITEDKKEVTYLELEDYCRNLANNVRGRALVFNLCQNTIGSLLGYVGFLQNKIVPVMLQDNIDEELFKNLFELYKPDFIYLPKNSAVKDFNFLKLGKEIYSNFDYVLIKTEFENFFTLNQELALLLTTSGSTGSRKLVRQSYKNIYENSRSIIEYLNLNENQRTITTLPMNYTYGISVINTQLLAGGSLFLTNKTIMQKEFWTQIKENKITSISGVPYIYEMLNKLKFMEMDLPDLKLLTQAGGRLSEDLHLKYAKWSAENNKNFFVMYGQTEATARMSYLPSEKSLDKIGSIGIAIPRGHFSIFDNNDNEIKTPNIEGELVFKGDNVAMGYAEKGEDLSKKNEWNGALKTGDMAKFDEDNFYYITGRKKRFLKIFGSRVNLDEVEHLIKNKYQDFDVACAGIDDKLYTFINNSEHLQDISAFVREAIGIHSSAHKVKYIDEIPKNESGKKNYKELEKYYD
jgi:acyl-CoA synthetase (AMP-forming)/AMP-acid ligase II